MADYFDMEVEEEEDDEMYEDSEFVEDEDEPPEIILTPRPRVVTVTPPEEVIIPPRPLVTSPKPAKEIVLTPRSMNSASPKEVVLKPRSLAPATEIKLTPSVASAPPNKAVLLFPQLVTVNPSEEITVTPSLDIDTGENGFTSLEMEDTENFSATDQLITVESGDEDDDIITIDSDEEVNTKNMKKKSLKPFPMPKKTMTFTVKIFSRGTGDNKTLVCGFDGCNETYKDFQAVMEHTKDHFRKQLNKEPEIIVQHVTKTTVDTSQNNNYLNYDNELILDDSMGTIEPMITDQKTTDDCIQLLTNPMSNGLPNSTSSNNGNNYGLSVNSINLPQPPRLTPYPRFNNNQNLVRNSIPTRFGLSRVTAPQSLLSGGNLIQNQANLTARPVNNNNLQSPVIVQVRSLASVSDNTSTTPSVTNKVAIHAQESNYKCPVKGCELTFLSQLGLSIHARFHAENGTSTDSKPPISTATSLRALKPAGMQFRCTSQGCKEAFTSYMDFLHHREKHKKSASTQNKPLITTQSNGWVRPNLTQNLNYPRFQNNNIRPVNTIYRSPAIQQNNSANKSEQMNQLDKIKNNSKDSFLLAYMSEINKNSGKTIEPTPKPIMGRPKKQVEQNGEPKRKYKRRKKSVSATFDFNDQVESLIKAQEKLGDGQKVTRHMLKKMLDEPLLKKDKSSPSEDTRYFLCPVEGCGVAIEESDIYAHLMVHTLPSAFTCSRINCTMEFETFEEYQEHKKTHKQHLKYPCPIPGCHKSFKNRNKLVHHRKEKHKSKSYRCVVLTCGRFFKSLHHLKCHLTVKHSLIADADSTTCTVEGCGQKSQSLGELHRHVMNEHVLVKQSVVDSSDEDDWKLGIDNMLQVGVDENVEGDVELEQMPQYIDMAAPLWCDTDGCLTADPEPPDTEAIPNEESDDGEEAGRKVDTDDEEFRVSDQSTPDEEEDTSDEDFKIVERKRKTPSKRGRPRRSGGRGRGRRRSVQVDVTDTEEEQDNSESSSEEDIRPPPRSTQVEEEIVENEESRSRDAVESVRSDDKDDSSQEVLSADEDALLGSDSESKDVAEDSKSTRNDTLDDATSQENSMEKEKQSKEGVDHPSCAPDEDKSEGQETVSSQPKHASAIKSPDKGKENIETTQPKPPSHPEDDDATLAQDGDDVESIPESLEKELLSDDDSTGENKLPSEKINGEKVNDDVAKDSSNSNASETNLYKCTFDNCEKSFAESSDLQEHKNKHVDHKL